METLILAIAIVHKRVHVGAGRYSRITDEFLVSGHHWGALQFEVPYGRLRQHGHCRLGFLGKNKNRRTTLKCVPFQICEPVSNSNTCFMHYSSLQFQFYIISVQKYKGVYKTCMCVN